MNQLETYTESFKGSGMKAIFTENLQLIISKDIELITQVDKSKLLNLDATIKLEDVVDLNSVQEVSSSELNKIRRIFSILFRILGVKVLIYLDLDVSKCAIVHSEKLILLTELVDLTLKGILKLVKFLITNRKNLKD
jgi:hypothetical protein